MHSRKVKKGIFDFKIDGPIDGTFEVALEGKPVGVSIYALCDLHKDS